MCRFQSRGSSLYLNFCVALLVPAPLEFLFKNFFFLWPFLYLECASQQKKGKRKVLPVSWWWVLQNGASSLEECGSSESNFY